MRPLSTKLVEEVDFVGAVLQHVADDVLDHGLGHVHVAGQVAEGHLRLDHPELGGVTLGVGILRAEGGTEGVHVTKGHGEALGIQLAGHGQAGRVCRRSPGCNPPVPSSGSGHVSRSSVVTRNISPAPSQSEPVRWECGRRRSRAPGRTRGWRRLHAAHPEVAEKGWCGAADAGWCAGTPRCGAFSAEDSPGADGALHLDGGGLHLQGLLGPGVRTTGRPRTMRAAPTFCPAISL